MELNYLYDIANNENISIIDFKMKNKALIEEIDGNYYIAMNYSNIANSNEEKVILSEELGHYYTGNLYNSYMKYETISKREYRALKWSFNTLVPYRKLINVIKNGINTIFELAEYFEVPINYMQKCLDFYNSKYDMRKELSYAFS